MSTFRAPSINATTIFFQTNPLTGTGSQVTQNNASIGVAAQSWQSVVGSRAFSTTYTNTTGRPIQITVGASTSGSGGGVEIQVNSIVMTAAFTNDISVQAHSGCVIVPPGAPYAAFAYGTATLSSWHELR